MGCVHVSTLQVLQGLDSSPIQELNPKYTPPRAISPPPLMAGVSCARMCVCTAQVVEQFEREGMVARVNGNQDIQTVFRDVLAALKPVQEKEVLDANRAALAAASAGDWTAYAEVRQRIALYFWLFGRHSRENSLGVFVRSAMYHSMPSPVLSRAGTRGGLQGEALDNRLNNSKLHTKTRWPTGNIHLVGTHHVGTNTEA